MQQKNVLGDKPPHRVQSPSSIGTFKQCPRKYYYSYIKELPTQPSIATTRGTIVHSVLENFFDIPLENTTWDTCEQHCIQHLQHLLLQEWQQNEELKTYNLTEHDRITLFEETLHMLINWAHVFIERLRTQGNNFHEAFKAHTPQREQSYHSDNFHTRGIIDAIEHRNGLTHVMDYKTSNHTDLDKYRLQLGIYALLYLEKHGTVPDLAGIYFLKSGHIKYLDVDEKLLNQARQEIITIHEHTKDLNKEKYPKHITGLCKWSTGQCDFYDTCRADD